LRACIDVVVAEVHAVLQRTNAYRASSVVAVSLIAVSRATTGLLLVRLSLIRAIKRRDLRARTDVVVGEVHAILQRTSAYRASSVIAVSLIVVGSTRVTFGAITTSLLVVIDSV
jgi:hypothetical protein